MGHPYLPGLTKAADSCSVQAHYDGKEAVEVPLSFAAGGGENYVSELWKPHKTDAFWRFTTRGSTMSM